MTHKTSSALVVAALCGAVSHTVFAWMQSPPSIPDVSVVSPDEYRIELENEYVRVARVKSPPRATVPMHSHPAPGGVIVTLTDQDSRVTGRDGTSRESGFSAIAADRLPGDRVRRLSTIELHDDTGVSEHDPNGRTMKVPCACS